MRVNAANSSMLSTKSSFRNSLLLTTTRAVFTVLNAASPYLSAKLAQQLYTTPPRYKRKLSNEDAHFMTQAKVFSIPYSSHPLRGFRWDGTNGKTVLLVHGWGAHPHATLPLARNLASAGYSVVTYEAPAHGKHPVKRSSPTKWADSLCAVLNEIGSVYGIVGHSVGASSIVIAAHTNLPSARLVLISPMTSIINNTNRFAEQVGVSAQAIEMMRQFAWSYSEPSGSRYASGWDTLFSSPEPERTLLIHDEDDQIVPIGNSEWLHGIWPKSQFLKTRSLGHNKILRDDFVISSVGSFLGND